MTKVARLAILCLCSVPIMAATQSPVGTSDSRAKAMTVLERTKTVRSTYSVYVWNRIKKPGQPVTEGWSAEYNSGKFHRVEVPHARLIADCAARTGTFYSVSDANSFSGPGVAKSACGIDTNPAILSARLISHSKGKFGPVDRIEIVDADEVRTYDVTTEGIIVGETIVERSTPRELALEEHSVVVEHKLPAGDIFSPASLAKSIVPERFKTLPPK